MRIFGSGQAQRIAYPTMGVLLDQEHELCRQSAAGKECRERGQVSSLCTH